ncbi:MAG TPA: hypothetical protein VJT12_08490 [Methyloceanibacter sp.]|nr:hypothetical protein [Methyloceanibacter sp.]
MRARGYRLSARTLGLALVAAVIALQAFLALHSGVAGIPGLFVIDLAGTRGGAGKPLHAATHDGGESAFAKSQESPPAPQEPPAETTGSTPTPDGEPNLEGLAEIPLKPWVRDDAEPEEERRHVSVPAGGGQPGETLPWDAVEPVPFDATAPKSAPTKGTGPQAPPPQPALATLPAATAVASWVKAKATEIKGIERARPLYHFEFWLEPPANVKGSVAAVTYEFNTPAVMPQTQMSSEQETGFRISAGGLACADKVTVTLKFRDGRSQRVEVDGCKLVS